MGIVFINYRRDQTAGEARALYNDLVRRLGSERVFMDVDNIALGRDFRDVLRERLDDCEVMLTLIGRAWIDARDAEGRRRLDQAGDFVRLEIATALERKVAVTPVLLQDARMPQPERLPDDLKALAFRNGFALSHATWESNVDELVRRLGFAGAAPASAPGAPPMPRSKTALAIGATAVVLSGALAAWLAWRPGPPPEPIAAPAAAPALAAVPAPPPEVTSAPKSEAKPESTPAAKPAPEPDIPGAATPAVAPVAVAPLISDLTSADRAARQAAAAKLQAQFLSSSEAVQLAVAQLEPNRFLGLAGASPRAQLLSFLLATDAAAWTPELRQRAAASIRGLRERAASGVVTFRPEMVARLDELARRVGA